MTEDRVMKRWLVNAGIATYFAALAFGYVMHVLAIPNGRATFMPLFFLKFNMFSGWSGYEARMEVLGEGASGKFYQLAPGPWGEFQPYGYLDRRHYDQQFENGLRFAQNSLKHTAHEPIDRILVVEAWYPKKFNLPDKQFEAYYNKPKNLKKYYHLRFVLNPDGEVLSAQPIWLRHEEQLLLTDNPRVVTETQRRKPFWGTQDPGIHGAFATGHFFEPPSVAPVRPPAAQ